MRPAIRRTLDELEIQRQSQAAAPRGPEILARLDGPFHFVLVDAWKHDYPAYFDLVFPKLRVAD